MPIKAYKNGLTNSQQTRKPPIQEKIPDNCDGTLRTQKKQGQIKDFSILGEQKELNCIISGLFHGILPVIPYWSSAFIKVYNNVATSCGESFDKSMNAVAGILSARGLPCRLGKRLHKFALLCSVVKK